ncbi:MAG: TIGR03663 family protein [Anaerolineae bacterium]|nr:TIGR03663 family protein [Anaerolineae bacterium]
MATREQTYSSPDLQEHAFTRALTRAYALDWEIIAYVLILVVALITRFVDLGARVMSHDESLHTYYSWRLYKFGEFQHTPLMHGPLLFHMTALSYFLFGDSDFTARIYPAAVGVLVVMYPLLFRRWLGRAGAVITSVLLLISPMLLYYTRYIRHDIPLIFFALTVLYALLQYIDGETPRRPVWLWVLSGALLGMLASKEVAFIYIAIFGSFLTLFWLMRMLQDVGIRRRPAQALNWQTPLFQQIVGHAILFALVAVMAFALGGFIRYAFSPVRWIPSAWWIQLPLFLAFYLPLALSGVLRTAFAGNGQPRDGAAGAIMTGLADGNSALRVILAGVIIGVIVTLVIICVIDVIKPTTVWTETVVRSQYDQNYGANGTKEYATSIDFDGKMYVRLLTWVALPAMVVLFVVFLMAMFKFPAHIPLPRREMVLIVLVALVTTSGLVAFERRSFVPETEDQPFAVDPNAITESEDGKYDDTPIWIAWLLGGAAILGVLGTRFLTGWWDFFDRQPTFDVLILTGTLILPWLAAFPIYWAGYNLEEYNPNTPDGEATLRAAVQAFIPFALLAITVGLSWNWKRWIPAAVIFIGMFAFFFTTVFSNQYGLATGMIGSLGYWLAQQGVRRGSQPQYYYILTQLPVYEFLPLIGSMFAGIAGLGALWDWRRARIEVPRDMEDALPGSPGDTLAGAEENTPVFDTPDGERAGDWEDEPAPGVVRYASMPSRLFRPFDLSEEKTKREHDPEWLGSVPFMGLVGYWAVMILLGLTVAGEKMPWLASHLTVPLILLTGWWLGRVLTGIRWRELRDGGWLVLLVILPLFFVALAQVIVPLWGEGVPFGGKEVEELTRSGNWLAALLIALGSLYVIGRIGLRLGWQQLGRMAIVSGALILAILTGRAAILASYINYDYATEFLVYAHAGPAVKIVMEEIDHIAEITNLGDDMRVVFDDESSWPYTWYFRNYSNYGFIRGEAGSVIAADLDGAKVVVVGSKKAGDVRRILGDGYYEFGYIRLWWPMQEYFNLTFDRVANVFSTDADNASAEYYREGIFDIWWNRDYDTYAQAMCIEDKQRQGQCAIDDDTDMSDEELNQFRKTCHDRLAAECSSEKRFEVNNWPVSDRMYFFVDKQVAAQVWDAGIGSTTIDIRNPEYPEDRVYMDMAAEAVIGEQAGLVGARGLAIGDDDRLYVADTDRNRIVVLTLDGEQVGTIGAEPGGSSEPGALLQPWGVDIGPDGNVYVADTWNHRVQVFSPEGELLHWWGHEGIPAQDPSVDAFWGPRDVAVGPDGNVYVADTGNKRVRVYTPEGEFIKDIGGAGSALGQLDEPVGLAFNPMSGDLYVADTWNRRISVFDRNGMAVRTWTVNMWFNNRESYNRPYLAVSPDGTLVYVTDMDDRHRVVAYDLNGTPVVAFNQPDNLEQNLIGLRSPAGLAFDSRSFLYVVDSELTNIFVFPTSEIAGSIPPVPPGGPGEDSGVILPEEPTEEPTEELTEEPPADFTGEPTEEATDEGAG